MQRQAHRSVWCTWVAVAGKEGADGSMAASCTGGGGTVRVVGNPRKHTSFIVFCQCLISDGDRKP